MDAMNSVKEDRFQSLLLNNRYEESVTKIDLKLYRNAALGEELLVESNLAPHGKRQVDLKVYISKRIKGEPARRVCKAVYTLTIKPK